MLVFFVNFNNSTLLVAELIGTTTTPCVLAINSNLHSPAGTFIVDNTIIYWSNFFNNTLFKGTLSQNTILNAQPLTGASFNLPNGLSVDTVNNKIYWVNQEFSGLDSPPSGTGSIYVGDLSDTVISNSTPLIFEIPEALHAPAGLFIDYTKTPAKIYWTDFYDSAMLSGDLSDVYVSNIQLLTGDGSAGDEIFGLPFGFPSGLFISQITGQIYWTSYFPSAIYVGDFDASSNFISNIQQITGPTFSGPNGIFIIEGSLTDPLIDVCDETCQSCVGLFIQFSDLARDVRHSLNLSNSDDIVLLSNALNLTQTYCFKMDWNHSSSVGGSARELAQILTTSDSDLDPIHLKIKQSLLNAQNGRDCCDFTIPD
jgi:hypothetical protein